MGIFDGVDQKQLSAGAIQPVTAEQIRQMQANNRAYNQATLTGVGAMNIGLQTQKERFDPNKSEAYQIPLSQLVAMWQVKYGDQWVDTRSDREWGDFYWAAETRLERAGLFEEAQGWVRLKENVEKLLADR